MAVLIQPLDYKEIIIDRAAVDRIVEAVESGRTKARAPADLDRYKLADDLNLHWRLYEDSKFARGDTNERQAAKKRLADIEKASAKLRQLLTDAPDDTTRFAIRVVGVDDVVKCLEKFEWSVAHFREHDFEKRKRLKLDEEPGSQFYSAPPLEDLLGFRLPAIYHEHFKMEPGGGRSASGSGGASPYLRFALAVGDAFGEPLNRETVLSYLKHWKSFRKKK